ncbi:hypothetical protein BKA70DRAFT_1258939 [Coprinopsis sp. MPI-PUGE-AT-0042]|nr:hypothetical protein BKA70DRAFT_1258939 [Coprinopsis sp. MPI-PUGE-AT-0042]
MFSTRRTSKRLSDMMEQQQQQEKQEERQEDRQEDRQEKHIESPIIIAPPAGNGYSPSRPRRVSSSSSSFSSDDIFSEGYSSTEIKDVLQPSVGVLKRRASAPQSIGRQDRRRVVIMQMNTIGQLNTAASSSSSSSSSWSPTAASSLTSSLASRRGLGGLALITSPDAELVDVVRVPPTSAPHHTATPSYEFRRETLATAIDGDGERVGQKRKPVPPDGVESGPGAIQDNNNAKSDLDHVTTDQQPPLESVSSCSASVVDSDLSTIGSTSALNGSHGDEEGVWVSVNAANHSHTYHYRRHLTSGTSISSEGFYLPVSHLALPPMASSSTVKLVSGSSRTSNAPASPSLSSFSTSKDASSSSPGTPFEGLEKTAYLVYQPGLHATAGPLPPPPRATFASMALSTPPPPRPPRLHSPGLPLPSAASAVGATRPSRVTDTTSSAATRADLEKVKQALQLPPSVAARAAKLATRSSASDIAAASSTSSQGTGKEKPKVVLPEVQPLNVVNKLQREGSTGTPKISPSSIGGDVEGIGSEVSSAGGSIRTMSVHRREGASSRMLSEPEKAQKIVEEEDDVPSVTVVADDDRKVVDDREEDVKQKADPDELELEARDSFDEKRDAFQDHQSHSKRHSYTRSASGSSAAMMARSSSTSSATSDGRGVTLRDEGPQRSHSPLSAGSSGYSPSRHQEHQARSLSASGSPRRSASLSSHVTGSSAPSPPPKSPKYINLNLSAAGSSLATNLKRLSSLPRTPSRASSTRSSKRSSSGTYYSGQSPPPTSFYEPQLREGDQVGSRTPSPSGHGHHRYRSPSPSLERHHRGGIRPTKRRRKVVDPNPSAMFCHEVYQQRTTAERCQIYIEKINELYMHDCGLEGWLVEMKLRGSSPSQPRGPSAAPFQPQPRQTSGASIISEATFPRRPDAYVATDLSTQSPSVVQDLSPATVAINLPYPSLATQQRQQSIRSTTSNNSTGSGLTPPPSVRSLAPSSGTSAHGHGGNSSLKMGFLASLGRKASISTGGGVLKKDRSGGGAGILGPGNGRTASTRDIGRPVLMSTTNVAHSQGPHSAVSAHGHGPPSVHGHGHGPSGPRAPPPNRAQRSKTLMIAPTTRHQERESALGRRPSLFDTTPPTLEEIYADPVFAEQVDKLHSVLPHADRAVLATYLRRAGQDVLAIGQYLEDERNGTLKYI